MIKESETEEYKHKRILAGRFDEKFRVELCVLKKINQIMKFEAESCYQKIFHLKKGTT